MLGRFMKLFRRPSVVVPGSAGLLEGPARTVDVGDPLADGRQLVLCRVEGRVYALDATCPHEGGRIAPGPLAEGRYAVCPLHGYRFDPRDGRAVGVACRPARTYRADERDGAIEVRF